MCPCLTIFFVTCTCFPIVIQRVSGQTEALVGAWGAFTDVLTAVVRLQTQINTYSTDNIRNICLGLFNQDAIISLISRIVF